MKFTYKAAGAEPLSWDFDPDKMLNAECMEIERRTGWDFAEWMTRFYRANMTAITAFLYVMLKRKEPGIKYDQVVFTMEEISFDVTDAEAAEARRALLEKQASEGLTPSEQATLDQLAAVEPEPAEVESAAPKD